ncbi:MAG: MarR family transcriptional regulator [Lachnospiraceae bacterium]|nr:MarR family transcriptional regulator [Lachnospiraceae bacterium]
MAAQEQKEEGITAFFRDTFDTDALYKGIERKDYYYLYCIRELSKNKSDNGKVYLFSLTEQLKMEMPEVSKMVGALEIDGYLQWETDVNIGRTYVTLTGKAEEILDKESARMRECYERIKSEINPDELNQMAITMKKIRDIIKQEDEE